MKTASTQLQQAGAKALATFELLSLPEIKQNKQAAAQLFRDAGAEAILILRLVDAATAYRDVRPGRERYASVITGYETLDWYDFYSVAFNDMSPTYGTMKQKVFLDTSLYDLGTGQRLWSTLTETVLTETTDRVAQMDPLVAKVLHAMRKDGIIR